MRLGSVSVLLTYHHPHQIRSEYRENVKKTSLVNNFVLYFLCSFKFRNNDAIYTELLPLKISKFESVKNSFTHISSRWHMENTHKR